MKIFSKNDIQNLEHLYKINLVNSCNGIKSANLIGSISKKGEKNLAVFSSVTHLGSSPALLGIVFRPLTVMRNTYENIKETTYFSINAIDASIYAQAHHTSAKYPKGVNEFDMANIPEELKQEHPNIPFVKNAPVQLLMKYQNEYEIQENGTVLLVASIENLYVEENLLEDDGFINLSKGNVMGINGLDGYTQLELKERLSYQRPKNGYWNIALKNN